MYYYEVSPTKIIRIDQEVFTYHSQPSLAIGQIVTIPVGKQSITGIVTRLVERPPYPTKEISAAHSGLILPGTLLATAYSMRDYYATHLATIWQTVLPRGVTKQRRQVTPTPKPPLERDRTNFLLNESQRSAISTITTMSPGTAILHGITGSGKTAVYIELAKQAIKNNRSVIVLVPEIALTSQLVAEFTQYFDNVILAHSQQTEAERHRTWQEALWSTTPRVVIGPRSALFMPLTHVGYVIIDEAHEPAYKQDQSPKYSALRVAAMLMKQTNGRVIQGSATPLVSEYFLAQHAGRPIIPMQQKARHETVRPAIKLVDMTKKTAFSRHRLFSDQLLDTIAQALSNKQQVLIYHNRRGSASMTLCDHCGWSAMCPTCFVPYTLHADLHKLRCHICGTQVAVPTSCPDCGGTDIMHKGIGTKLIESELRRLFPKQVIARFDGDNKSQDTLDQRYDELYSGAIDIIVGTQVIAKGLDLPRLAVVGVVQADAGLSLPDYISTERTFQLLAQVVGRVGRSSTPSTVIVQTYQPNAPAIRLGLAQQYEEFFDTVIKERQRAHFPPYSYLLKLSCTYRTEATAARQATHLAKLLKAQYGKQISVLGPAPAFYERQHDSYRWQLTIRARRRATLVDMLKMIPAHWQIDLDPASLL